MSTTVPNYRLAAHIVYERGLLWLKDASPRDMSEATNATLKAFGLCQDTRQAITCLKAIREYVIKVKL